MDETLEDRVKVLEAEVGRWKAAHEALAHRLDETEQWMTNFVNLVSQALSH